MRHIFLLAAHWPVVETGARHGGSSAPRAYAVGQVARHVRVRAETIGAGLLELGIFACNLSSMERVGRVVLASTLDLVAMAPARIPSTRSLPLVSLQRTSFVKTNK